jgi:hypothetical protein
VPLFNERDPAGAYTNVGSALPPLVRQSEEAALVALPRRAFLLALVAEARLRAGAV